MRIIFIFFCMIGFFGCIFAQETHILIEDQITTENMGSLQNNQETELLEISDIESKGSSLYDKEFENLDFVEGIPQIPLPNVVIENEIKESEESKTLKSQGDILAPQVTIEDRNAQETSNHLTTNNETANSSLVKNVYLEVLTPLVDIVYVNQVVALELKMLIFTQYSTITTEFIFKDSALKNSVEVLNPNQAWTLNLEDSSLRNIFYLKIKQSQFVIPEIKVNVFTDNGLVSEKLPEKSYRAIKLERKGEYSQVLAQDLQILDTKITTYDSTQNLAVFQLQSIMGNLFDFHLEDFKQQGIESKSGDYKQAVAFYYAIVPKTLNTISFDYFNTLTSKYQTLQIPNIANEDRVSTQSDIKPKNNYQFFQISLLVFFAILFFGLYLYKRKIIFALLGIFALVLLLYFLTLKSEVTLKANVALRIQPTFNSTIVLTTQSAMRAEILGERNNYYKVILGDEHIGWIKKDDIQD